MPGDKTELEIQIEELAKLQFMDEEIALVVEMNEEELLRQYASNIDRGRLLAESEVRKSILQMAKQGSTPAQKQFMELNFKLKQKKRKTINP